jgi:hypothetical protein
MSDDTPFFMEMSSLMMFAIFDVVIMDFSISKINSRWYTCQPEFQPVKGQRM